MKKFLEKIKREINLRKSILRSRSASNGMTYVELIVVLAIFATMSSVILFNYQEFQARVDIKNLASKIALKIVEAQKASLSGNLPPVTLNNRYQTTSTWKPSYGIYFDNTINNSFIYFTDLDNTTPPQNEIFDGASDCTGECLDKVTIAGGVISDIEICSPTCTPVGNPFSITFKRTDYKAIFTDQNLANMPGDYIKITIKSLRSDTVTSTIKVYSIGRIQIN